MSTRENTNRAREGILREINDLMEERRHLKTRQAQLKGGKPRRGREQLVKRCIRRYGVEIADINRRIGLLEANLEGLTSL